jgi:hypothetical protein
MSSLRRSVIAATLAAAAGACATAEPPGSGGGPDARPPVDARNSDARNPDASLIDGPLPTDARPIDARVPDAAIDAGPTCTTMVLQRLVNPAFDAVPIGTGWTEVRIDPTAALITNEGAVQSAPNSAWMGGFETGSDELRQDVIIPLGTTQLVLRGYYGVATDEIFGPFDFSELALTTPANVILESAILLDDTDAGGSWMSFQKVFNGNYSGQTVRVRIRSSNDGSLATSFFYDTLALDATVCQ